MSGQNLSWNALYSRHVIGAERLFSDINKNKILSNQANIWWQNVFTPLLLTGLVMGPVTILSAQQDRPNILWITSEDNSPLIGAYGDEFATTPFIDQLASEGVL